MHTSTAGEFCGLPGKDLVPAALTVRSAGSASCSRSNSLRCSAAKQALMWCRSTPSTTSVPLCMQVSVTLRALPSYDCQ